MTEHSGPAREGSGEDDGFEIPVFDTGAAGSAADPGPGPAPAAGSAADVGARSDADAWTDSGPGTDPDPGSGGDPATDPAPEGGSGPVGAAPAGRRAPAGRLPGESGDWTRTDSVRDDPGTLGEEVRKLWEVVHDHFVDPVLRNYPEAAGHLTSAGLEVASAFRALVRGGEQRWTGKPPAGPAGGAEPDWDGRIVIGEDGGDNDDDTADRPKD